MPRRPFVGRDAERAELDVLLDRIASEQGGGLVLLGGEPGVGKTRLAEELLLDARARGYSTLTGRNYEEGAAPFIPLVEMLDHLAMTLPAERLREALGDYAPEIARLAPELRHRLPDLPEPAELPAVAMLGERDAAAVLHPLVTELLRLGHVISAGSGLGLIEKTAGKPRRTSNAR